MLQPGAPGHHRLEMALRKRRERRLEIAEHAAHVRQRGAQL